MFKRSTTSFLENPVEEEVIEIAHPQIIAWRQKGSYHKAKSKKEKQEINAIKERDEKQMSESRILGITDLNKGEDARDFILKSAVKESRKQEGNPL